MSRRLISWCVLAASLGVAVPAAAGPVDRRQNRQEQRIVKGVRSGEITRREAARLQREESRLAFEEARYRLSGQGVSERERADLQRDLNRITRNIYRQAHDRQSR